jgi:hypothetical protein
MEKENDVFIHLSSRAYDCAWPYFITIYGRIIMILENFKITANNFANINLKCTLQEIQSLCDVFKDINDTIIANELECSLANLEDYQESRGYYG